MPVDVAAAETFIWNTARAVDRHRYALLFCDGPAQPVVDSLLAYRNADGGFGHALEPDLRCPGSQTAATLYALEMLAEAGALGSAPAREAVGWIGSVADDDGGLPFVLPGFEDYPHTFWWAPTPGSFLTFAVAAVLLEDGGFASDPWLSRAVDWCWAAIDSAESPSGYWLKHACAFLDAVPDEARAVSALESLRARLKGADAIGLPDQGAEGEALRPLDLSPHPGSRSRLLVPDALIEEHLDRVEAEQQEDGGWMFDWLAWAPEQITAWRGVVTIRALQWLRSHGRI